MYDYRQKNAAAQNPAWVAEHPYEIEHYGVCLFDLLTPGDRAALLKLPAADSQSGTQSDYCQ